MGEINRIIDLARKDLKGTLTDDDLLFLASNLDEWKRVLIAEDVQVNSELRTLKNTIGQYMNASTQTRILSRKQSLIAYSTEIRARVRSVCDQIKKRNIANNNNKSLKKVSMLRAFLNDTRDMLPFEEPYLDWHVRCAQVLFEDAEDEVSHDL